MVATMVHRAAGHERRHAGVVCTAPARGGAGPGLQISALYGERVGLLHALESRAGSGSCLLRAQAVSACRQAWGERRLSELDAEDRLATACEKAPTSDPATSALRAAFQVPPRPAPTLDRC